MKPYEKIFYITYILLLIATIAVSFASNNIVRVCVWSIVLGFVLRSVKNKKAR